MARPAPLTVQVEAPALDALAADLKRLTTTLDANDNTTAGVAIRAIQLMREAGEERDQFAAELGKALDHVDRVTIAFNEVFAIFEGAPEYADAVARWQTALDKADPAEQGAPVDWPAIVRQRETDLKQEGAARHEAEQQRDGAYRERAQLLAWLAALHPAVRTLAPDITDEPGWQILYLNPTTGGQMSWHIAPRDIELFDHVEYVPAGSGDERALWDGHTTEAKYERIADLTRFLADVADATGTKEI